jgi:hypothetical protein
MRDHNGIMASNISQVQPPIWRERGLLRGGGTFTASRTRQSEWSPQFNPHLTRFWIARRYMASFFDLCFLPQFSTSV